MSLNAPTAIDMIVDLSTRRDPRVGLIIVDDGTIGEPRERIAALHKKLAFYAYMLQIGHIAHAYPDLKDARPSIEVVCSQLPATSEMRRIQRVIRKGEPTVDAEVRVWDSDEFQRELERLAA
ncbi:MAG: hypothetical protein IT535_10140 [Bauldia sp.]|nr:hypothetical protein [Bauldia sp.]